MTDFALLAAACDWQPGYRQRLIEACRATGLEGPAADELAATSMEHSGGRRVAAILDGDGHRIAPGRPRRSPSGTTAPSAGSANCGATPP
ncbi:hypothetical protein ACH4UR_31330 [Streptomyces lydicus]|uniref:hypothetical protein n=1 Tax=Streptomyces lydicus TaxID=47763 RepID=UPI0033D1421F